VKWLVALLVAMSVPVAAAPATALSGDPQWYLSYLHIREAHRITQGEGVTVAVIDSGVYPGHPDLAGSVLPGVDLIDPPDSPDGRLDPIGHGTQMAGVIAAHGRTVGIAPKAKILPIRAADGVDQLRIAQALDFAVAHGASVINMSVGTPVDDLHTRAAVDRALASNVVLVAAVGNRPEDDAIRYPAAYPGVVAVAGTDREGYLAAFSVPGPQVAIAAPAVDIYSLTVHGNRPSYEFREGTSEAAAIVAGVAALVRSRFPNLSAADVVHRLTATADDVAPPGRDNATGYGIVDPVRALDAVLGTGVPLASAEPASSVTPIVLIGLIGLLVLALLTGVIVVRRRHGVPSGS
jgi:type VII secretion-associated serine protease mycosin